MKREIKFRGKCQRPENGVWISGSLATTMNGGLAIMPDCYWTSRDLGDEDDDGQTILSEDLALGGFMLVIPETVGQYTGLKDKNGVEIYEGDIITYDMREGLGEPALYNKKETVEFYRDNCHHITSWYRNIRVIGNIHDNPELLK